MKLSVAQRFSRLTVLADDGWRSVRCRCECGAETIVQRADLRHGRVKSCGCWTKDRLRTHGCRRTQLYACWCNMIQRCENPRVKEYRWYGARGVRVCDRWRKSFAAFRDDMGERPSPRHSLDRINMDGAYEKANCRWATPTQQNRNRRANRILEHAGVRLSVAEWAERLGVPARRIYCRLSKGWSAERALTAPRMRSRWEVFA